MIYLDNAATTHYKPQNVVDAVTLALTKYSYNPNRGSNKQAQLLQQRIYDTRRVVCALLNGYSPDNTVFTANTTAALNLAILGRVVKGGHVITTATEHNSVLRPLNQLYRRGHIQLTVVTPRADGKIYADDVISSIRPNTYMTVFCHTSNVTGTKQDVATLCKAVKYARPDIITLLDCAQSVGYSTIDMKNFAADMVAIPAHKGLHGMQGCGVLCFSESAKPRPITFGGTGTDSNNLLQPDTLPDGLEAGTLNCPSILALYAAIEWWADAHKKYLSEMSNQLQLLIDGLQTINGVSVYSQLNQSGIVAFNIKGYDSSIIADILNQKYDIAVRGGVQCAPLMHKWLGTSEQGVVRVSLGCDNTREDCYQLLNAVQKLAKLNTL